MKPKLGEFFWTKTAEFWLAYQFGRLAGRPDEVGAPREEMVRKFLASILPPTIGIAKGHIIYKKIIEENIRLDISLEFDIILYDARISPVFPWDGDERIKAIPFEHIYGIIEVKSILNDSQIENVSLKKSELDKVESEAKDAAKRNPRPSSLPSIHAYTSLVGERIDHDSNEIDENGDDATSDDHSIEEEYSEEELRVIRHPSPFFYVFAFSEAVTMEASACDCFCRHAGFWFNAPDALFILDGNYCIRRDYDLVQRAIAFAHGASLLHSADSVAFADETISDTIFVEWSYRRDYWRSTEAPETDCLAAFLNFVSISCEQASQSVDRLQLDLGQLLGLWLKSSPLTSTLGRFQPVNPLPIDELEPGS
jgi:hypothetical protein